ncbi:hypothetical protein [Nonomuraea glycinis]|jgi:hypothetical protein
MIVNDHHADRLATCWARVDGLRHEASLGLAAAVLSLRSLTFA